MIRQQSRMAQGTGDRRMWSLVWVSCLFATVSLVASGGLSSVAWAQDTGGQGGSSSGGTEDAASANGSGRDADAASSGGTPVQNAAGAAGTQGSGGASRGNAPATSGTSGADATPRAAEVASETRGARTGAGARARPAKVRSETGRKGAASEKSQKKGDEDHAPVERQSAHTGGGETGFAFGSYGRVSAATDGHGSSAKPMNVVSHGTRLEESPYLELDFYYRLKPYKGIRFQTVVTLGFTDDLFHYTGDWSSMLALRNLYLQADDVFIKGLSVWGGSRQYRGDDIYLLDYWPLDNLNTVGGGIIFQRWGLWAGLHAGVNRLRNEYQYQVVPVPGLNNTSEDVVLLDRQRFITSLKLSQRFGGKNGHIGFKVTGYAEVHAVGSGTYNAHLEPDKQEQLPADQGWLVGAQFGLWNFGQRATHLNLFIRYAQGLAAYGEMAVPWGIAPDRTARRAKDLVFALSGNYEWNRLSVLVGGYLRYFVDADGEKYDWDDGWEYIVSVRPQVWIFRHFAQAFEASYQGKWPFGLEPRTDQVERPGITKLSVMPMVVFGKGSYDRPQLRLVYTVAFLNEGARLMYNEMDPRRNRKIQHYIGLQAEWWYNSTYR